MEEEKKSDKVKAPHHRRRNFQKKKADVKNEGKAENFDIKENGKEKEAANTAPKQNRDYQKPKKQGGDNQQGENGEKKNSNFSKGEHKNFNKNQKKPYRHKKKVHAEEKELLSEQAKQNEQENSVLAEIQINEEISDIPESPEVSFDETEKAEEETKEIKPKSEVKVEVVGIRFKSSGKTYYFDPTGFEAHKGEFAIVDTARGLEYGEVALANTFVSESDIVPPLRAVIRIANDEDKKHHEENKAKEQQAFVTCNERIIAHNLDMKLIDAQYTFDNTKLLFYFTSSGRVDFRELVKDLASVFRTRIELRQIGIRDEAKLIGGIGMCGRPLCCSTFLSDFGQVSIKMAKEQNLSLNSAKISGVCGRLMCCLRFEHETYEYEIKRTPPVDSTVKTDDGIGTVIEISPLTGMIKVKLNDKPDVPPKSYHRDNVKVISKK